MNEKILQWLKCLHCEGSELTCSAFKINEDGDVEDGLLSCSCGASYPIVRGVLRMLPSPLSEMLVEDYGWFFKQYESLLKDYFGSMNLGVAQRGQQTSSVKQTAKSFGYEWTQFSRMIEQYEQNFQHYFEGYSTDFFNDKLVLDAGCGTGRHTYYAAKYGAEVVGIDLSRAIDVAYQNNRNNAYTHFIQADLTNLPLKHELFDMVYSLGVLHHLPDPESGFKELLKYAKTGGLMHIYVYGNLENAPRWHRALLSGVTAVRRVTTQMPRPLLKKLSTAFAALCYIGLIIPARVLKTSPLADWAIKNIPLHIYSEYPFYTICNDTLDRFSAPLERRYGRSQVLEWFDRNGLYDVCALGGSGWRVSGRVNSIASV